MIDGDSYRLVPGAKVAVGPRVQRVDRRGFATVPVGASGWFRVRASAPGYTARTARLRLRTHPLPLRIRIFRPELQWPIYGATPARTQAHPAIRLRPPFRAVWARGVGHLIEFPAVVWQGVAYVNNMRGTLHAISMGNGDVLWRAKVGSTMASSPAVVPHRREIVTTSKYPGTMAVVDLRTAKVKWQYPIGPAEPSPVVRGRLVYVASTNGRVYAIDLARRAARWVFYNGSKVTSSPALVGNRLYFGDYAGRVRALDARNGRLLWTGSAGSRVYGTAAVGQGRVFAPSVFSGLSALSASSGRTLWRVPLGSYGYSSPAYFNGRVYVGSYSGTVYCIHARTGRVLWTRYSGGITSGAVQVVGGVVYAGSVVFGRRAGIKAWDWRTGRLLWTFPHGQYVPVSGNGSRLLMHGFSKIWAVAPKKR